MERGMKAKTIKSVLRKKTNEWLESIEDKQLKEQCKRDAVITGGSIASMLIGEKVSDFDIYFTNMETTKAVAKYYVEKFKENMIEKKKGLKVELYVKEEDDVHGKPRVKVVAQSAGVESEERKDEYKYFEQADPEEAASYVSDVFDDPGEVADLMESTESKLCTDQDDSKCKPYRPVFLSTNAITLAGKIQIVLRFYGEPDEIHENYDFTHCTNYWTSKDNNLVLRPEALQSLLSRTLTYQGSRYPVCSLFRIRKFINRGWRINAGQILKIALQVAKLDLEDYKVLEDQLTGVDVAYFAEILEACKKAGKEERVDSAYLVEIIDRMFGE